MTTSANETGPEEKHGQAGMEALWPDAEEAERLSDVFVRYAPLLFRYFWMQTGSRTEAQDLVSSVFLRLLDSRALYRPQSAAFTAWLYGLARSELAHYRSKVRKQPQVLGGDCLQQVEEQMALSAEARMDLWAAVARLDEGERDLLSLKFGAGLMNREIAAVLGTSASSVGTLLYRALFKLRALLSDGKVCGGEEL
ncbi:MAG: RNA polymerase sigma factor [Anaerolineae bacterium]